MRPTHLTNECTQIAFPPFLCCATTPHAYTKPIQRMRIKARLRCGAQYSGSGPRFCCRCIRSDATLAHSHQHHHEPAAQMHICIDRHKPCQRHHTPHQSTHNSSISRFASRVMVHGSVCRSVFKEGLSPGGLGGHWRTSRNACRRALAAGPFAAARERSGTTTKTMTKTMTMTSMDARVCGRMQPLV